VVNGTSAIEGGGRGCEQIERPDEATQSGVTKRTRRAGPGLRKEIIIWVV